MQTVLTVIGFALVWATAVIAVCRWIASLEWRKARRTRLQRGRK